MNAASNPYRLSPQQFRAARGLAAGYSRPAVRDYLGISAEHERVLTSALRRRGFAVACLPPRGSKYPLSLLAEYEAAQAGRKSAALAQQFRVSKSAIQQAAWRIRHHRLDREAEPPHCGDPTMQRG